MLRNLSIWHMLILLAVVVLVFGVRRLPELGSGLGKGIREFKANLFGKDDDPEDESDPNRLSD